MRAPNAFLVGKITHLEPDDVVIVETPERVHAPELGTLASAPVSVRATIDRRYAANAQTQFYQIPWDHDPASYDVGDTVRVLVQHTVIGFKPGPFPGSLPDREFGFKYWVVGKYIGDLGAGYDQNTDSGAGGS